MGGWDALRPHPLLQRHDLDLLQYRGQRPLYRRPSYRQHRLAHSIATLATTSGLTNGSKDGQGPRSCIVARWLGGAARQNYRHHLGSRPAAFLVKPMSDRTIAMPAIILATIA